MKLGINEIEDGIYNAAIEKLTKQLTKDGFVVEREKLGNDIVFDLFAYKDSDKRIYELKLGKNRIQEKQFLYLQKHAQNIGAKLYIIYLEIPKSKQIEFYDINTILLNDLNRHTPSSLISLATHVYINDIDNVDITSLIVDKDIIRLEGNGLVYVEAQYGSPKDLDEGYGTFENLEFEFTFRLKLDHYNRKVLDAYYKIDTSYFYR